ncbi:MAG: hypothetical protein BGO98_10560 [Myxococcales bacterium 68-20]|nr:MAG: hypothetical protein BGO98_10560 [Myxococcales bacterium 68-20]
MSAGSEHSNASRASLRRGGGDAKPRRRSSRGQNHASPGASVGNETSTVDRARPCRRARSTR